MVQALIGTLIPLHTHQWTTDLYPMVCLQLHYNQISPITVKAFMGCTVLRLLFRARGANLVSSLLSCLFKCLDGARLQDLINRGFLRDSRAFFFLILSHIILRVGGEMVHRGVEHDLIFSIETQT